MDKLKLVKTTGINQIAIGVAYIFRYSNTLKTEKKYGWKTFIPNLNTPDNAAMIGIWDIKILKSKFEAAAVVSKHDSNLNYTVIL
jgi:tRNA A37 threonylcarbamoyltransferase TsaD